MTEANLYCIVYRDNIHVNNPMNEMLVLYLETVNKQKTRLGEKMFTDLLRIWTDNEMRMKTGV